MTNETSSEAVMTEAPCSNAVGSTNDLSNQSEVSTMSKPLTKKEEMNQYKEGLKVKAREIVEEYQDFFSYKDIKKALREIFPELQRNMKSGDKDSQTA